MTQAEFGILLGVISIAIAIVGIGVTFILRVNTFAGKLQELLGRPDTKTD